MPEIIWLCCTYIRPFMVNGQALPLDANIKKDWKQGDIDDFYKGPFDAYKVDGKQYALPVYVNTNILFVNRGHLKEAGLAYPDENWDRNKFVDYMTKLTKRGGERWGYDMNFTGLDRNISWIWNSGAEPHDPKDGPVVTKLLYDDPKTVAALDFLHDLIWKQQVSPASNDQRGGQGQTDAFMAGKSTFYLDATGTGGTFVAKAPSNLDWDFAPLVKGPAGYGARISTDGYMIDRGTKVADQAWTVLKELTSPESETQRATLSKRQPARKSVATSWEKSYEGKNGKLGRLMAETARPDARAFWKDANQVEAIIRKYLDQSFARNEITVAQATKQAMDEVRGYYGNK
jgi:multiple sugar transport system substrate-binding protein